MDPYGRLLLQLRSRDARVDPGVWNAPGGKIEDDEDPEAGARRELLEETGLVAGMLELYMVMTVGRPEGFSNEGKFWVFYGPTWAREAQCLEGEAMVFVPAHQVPRLVFSRAASVVVPPFLESGHYRNLLDSIRKVQA